MKLSDSVTVEVEEEEDEEALMANRECEEIWRELLLMLAFTRREDDRQG